MDRGEQVRPLADGERVEVWVDDEGWLPAVVMPQHGVDAGWVRIRHDGSRSPTERLHEFVRRPRHG